MEPDIGDPLRAPFSPGMTELLAGLDEGDSSIDSQLTPGTCDDASVHSSRGLPSLSHTLSASSGGPGPAHPAVSNAAAIAERAAQHMAFAQAYLSSQEGEPLKSFGRVDGLKLPPPGLPFAFNAGAAGAGQSGAQPQAGPARRGRKPKPRLGDLQSQLDALADQFSRLNSENTFLKNKLKGLERIVPCRDHSLGFLASVRAEQQRHLEGAAAAASASGAASALSGPSASASASSASLSSLGAGTGLGALMAAHAPGLQSLALTIKPDTWGASIFEATAVEGNRLWRSGPAGPGPGPGPGPGHVSSPPQPPAADPVTTIGAWGPRPVAGSGMDPEPLPSQAAATYTPGLAFLVAARTGSGGSGGSSGNLGAGAALGMGGVGAGAWSRRPEVHLPGTPAAVALCPGPDNDVPEIGVAEVEQLKRTTPEEFRALWKFICLKLAVLVLSAETHGPNSPQHARMERFLDRICVFMDKVLLLSPMCYIESMYVNVETGEHEAPGEDFWMRLGLVANLSPEQLDELESVAHLFEKNVSPVMAERRALTLELSARIMALNGESRAAITHEEIAARAAMDDVIERLRQNVLREHRAHWDISDFLCYSVLTPLQLAKCMAAAYPIIPDCVATMEALRCVRTQQKAAQHAAHAQQQQQAAALMPRQSSGA